MKRHLNTLFVTTQGTYLARKGETLVARVEKETLLRLPLHTIESIACFGRVSMSPGLMGHCAELGVTVSFFSLYGRYLARVVGPASGNVLLRRSQYRLADDQDGTADVARSIIAGKVANSRTVLQRHLRDHASATGADDVREAVAKQRRILERLANPIPLDTARGLEGDAARIYFGVFKYLTLSDHDQFRFTQRSRRPPLDPPNALLSFCYTLLVHDVRSACEGVGLDPQVGYLHRDRPGRPSLALDLMEELRAVIADRLTLSLINRQQVEPKRFRRNEVGGVEMDDKTRKVVLAAYQQRKQTEITHPFLGEKVTLGLVAHMQARLLARFLRGDLDAYPPYFWK
jgi:CRISP-associated protein Cas1